MPKLRIEHRVRFEDGGSKPNFVHSPRYLCSLFEPTEGNPIMALLDGIEPDVNLNVTIAISIKDSDDHNK